MTSLNRLEPLPPYRRCHNVIKERDRKLLWIAVIIPVAINIINNRLTYGIPCLPSLFINKAYLKNPIKIELKAWAKLFSAFLLTFALIPFGPVFFLLWLAVGDYLVCRLSAYCLYNFFKTLEQNPTAINNIDYLIHKLPNCISKYA